MNEGDSPEPARPSNESPAARDPTAGRGEGSPADPWIEIRGQIGFYRHLLDFEQEMLERMRGLAADHPEELRVIVERFDIGPMEAMIGEFHQRLAFWRQLDGSDRRP